MTDSQPTATPDAPVVEATDARQGRRGKHILWVLVISMILVIVAIFGAWGARAPDGTNDQNAAVGAGAAFRENGQGVPADTAPVTPDR